MCPLFRNCLKPDAIEEELRGVGFPFWAWNCTPFLANERNKIVNMAFSKNYTHLNKYLVLLKKVIQDIMVLTKGHTNRTGFNYNFTKNRQKYVSEQTPLGIMCIYI